MPHKSSPIQACISNTSRFLYLVVPHSQPCSTELTICLCQKTCTHLCLWSKELQAPSSTAELIFSSTEKQRTSERNPSAGCYQINKPVYTGTILTCPFLRGFSPPLVSLRFYQCPLFPTFSGADTIVYSFYLWESNPLGFSPLAFKPDFEKQTNKNKPNSFNASCPSSPHTISSLRTKKFS